MTSRSTDLGKIDPASFRDPEGFVFEHGNGICRTLSPAALRRFSKLRDSGLFQELIDDGLVIPTRMTSAPDGGIPLPPGYDGVMIHERVTPVTYPAEWSFGMLKDAALLTLRLSRKLLRHGLILKDANPYNVMFHNGGFTQTDVLSIAEYEGGPWAAYGQFCESFLYPLFLEAYLGVSFQSYLRAHPYGVPVRSVRPLFRMTDIFRPGVFAHVMLRARLEDSFRRAKLPSSDNLTKVYGAKQLGNLLTRLEKLVDGLSPPEKSGDWKDYEKTHSYSAEDRTRKERFIKAWASEAQPKAVADIGCNTGFFSFALAASVDRVVSIDADAGSIDRLYCDLKSGNARNISPIVCDICDPTPGSGWMAAERAATFQRVKTDGFLALALIHHVCISNNLPLDRFVIFLRHFGDAGVVEWVGKGDEMVQTLLMNRADIYDGYTREKFEKSLKRCFSIEQVIDLKGGHRRLYRLGPSVPAD